MRDYRKSDYALNKFSEGIVYGFADGAVEITLADYLRENPHKTKQDFLALKALSDEMYHEQDLGETAYGKRARNLDWLDESEKYATPALDALLVEKSEKKNALLAAQSLLESGELTEVQRRRFIQHFFSGLSYREIAQRENVFFTSIAESVGAAVKKLQKYFQKL